MTKVPNPQHMLSSIVDLLTALIEDEPDMTRERKLQEARELVLQVAMDEAVDQVTPPSGTRYRTT
jgi:hypothetical protein